MFQKTSDPLLIIMRLITRTGKETTPIIAVMKNAQIVRGSLAHGHPFLFARLIGP